MGSDLYMEQQSFRPGPPRISWVDRSTILVETEVFYTGYREFYQGPLTAEVKKILDNMGIVVPPVPPMKDTELAEALHDMLCQFNHTDMCGWWYEGTEESPNWGGYAHERYLQKARKLMKLLPDIDPDDIITVAKTVKEL